MNPDPKQIQPKKNMVKCSVNSCIKMYDANDTRLSKLGFCRVHTSEFERFGVIKKPVTGKSKSFLKSKSSSEHRIELEKTLASFQKLRKLQEADQYGMVEIVGGLKMKANDPYCHGGHFYSSSIMATAFDWRNVWPQAARDNKSMFHGYNDDEAKKAYQKWLIKKIGEPEFIALEALSRTTVKYTILELREKRSKYDQAIKEILSKK